MRRWINASTARVEMYVKDAPAGTAVVFRLRSNDAQYVAYVMARTQNYLADLIFPTLEDAQNWVDRKLDEGLQERSIGKRD